jgi:hypothetical protein
LGQSLTARRANSEDQSQQQRFSEGYMKIIDAEPQLVREIIEEMTVTESRKRSAFTVHIGHHRLLGRLAVVEDKNGAGVILELD